MGALISLDFMKISHYLKELGYSKPSIRVWLFDKLNTIFLIHMDEEMKKSQK